MRKTDGKSNMPDIQPGYLDKAGAAKYLGQSVRWLESRMHEIPQYRPGSKVLFRRSELDSWMDHYRVRPSELDLKSIVDKILK